MTRFATCIPPELGGSGNPSFATAKGVVCAMEAALLAAGRGPLSGKRIVVQGLGNVARAMIGELLARNVAGVVAADISERQVATAHARFATHNVELRHVSPDDTAIYGEPGDVFAPCALGGILNPQTIPLIAARIVCGAANNQLLDDQRDDQLLDQRGILYVPDFVANRMGIVSCANEQYGVLPGDPAVARHFDPNWDNSLAAVTTRVIARARAERITTTRAANALADELGREPHPLWPKRGLQIRAALQQQRWHES
jgi:glutamate dehydrogenase/leucine dehydrogenase